jgi:hypothetical protein
VVLVGWKPIIALVFLWLEVVNDVFNGMEYALSYRPARSHSVSSMTPYCRID